MPSKTEIYTAQTQSPGFFLWRLHLTNEHGVEPKKTLQNRKVTEFPFNYQWWILSKPTHLVADERLLFDAGRHVAPRDAHCRRVHGHDVDRRRRLQRRLLERALQEALALRTLTYTAQQTNQSGSSSFVPSIQ